MSDQRRSAATIASSPSVSAAGPGIGTKRGLAPALHSGDPVLDSSRENFEQRLQPALRALLDSATEAGAVRTDIDVADLLSAVASLCMPARDDGHARRMVGVLVDGLRYGAPLR